MGFLRGFIEFERIEQSHVPVEERVKSFCEIYGTLSDEEAKIQKATTSIHSCMNRRKSGLARQTLTGSMEPSL